MNWLRNYSPNTIAAVVIVVGLALIIYSNPPRTVCDAEVETFQRGTVGVLYIHPQAAVKVVRFHQLAENCKQTAGPGGCLELFSGMKKVLLELTGVSPQCLSKVGELKEVRGSLFRTLDIMAKLAWGSKPPEHSNLKVGFFDASDLNLFCQIRTRSQQIYGSDEWQKFQGQSLRELPGINTIAKTDAWDRSLYSLNCSQYM